MAYSATHPRRVEDWYRHYRDTSKDRRAAKLRHLARLPEEERAERIRLPFVTIQHKPEEQAK